nr:hypothetical protein [uncultured Bdellovibrio sp.]
MKAKKILFYTLLPLFALLAMVGVPPPVMFNEQKKDKPAQSENLKEEKEEEKK